jgi:hypothetical protein
MGPVRCGPETTSPFTYSGIQLDKLAQKLDFDHFDTRVSLTCLNKSIMVNSNTAHGSAVAVSASVSALRLANRYCFSDFLSSFLNGSPHIVLARNKARY